MTPVLWNSLLAKASSDLYELARFADLKSAVSLPGNAPADRSCSVDFCVPHSLPLLRPERPPALRPALLLLSACAGAVVLGQGELNRIKRWALLTASGVANTLFDAPSGFFYDTNARRRQAILQPMAGANFAPLVLAPLLGLPDSSSPPPQWVADLQEMFVSANFVPGPVVATVSKLAPSYSPAASMAGPVVRNAAVDMEPGRSEVYCALFTIAAASPPVTLCGAPGPVAAFQLFRARGVPCCSR